MKDGVVKCSNHEPKMKLGVWLLRTGESKPMQYMKLRKAISAAARRKKRTKGAFGCVRRTS